MTREQQLRQMLDREQGRLRELARTSREELLAAKREARDLRREIEPLRREAAERESHRKAEEDLAKLVLTAKPLPWLIRPKRSVTADPGVPLLNLSDLHMNETVAEEEIAYRNEFNPEIASARLHRVFQNALDISFGHTTRPKGHRYPGEVVCVGGDLFDNLATLVHLSDPRSGSLREAMSAVITGLATGLRAHYDAFGRLLIVVVPGNHARTTLKMPMASPSASNLDVVICDRLREHHLLAGLDIEWVIAPGDEARFLVYDHAFVLTHGYQYRGGDGEVGALGPIQRGVKRLRAKYMQLGLRVDTVLVEHFHHLLYDPGNFIVNGSLKGYDSMAMRFNFPYQPPMQGLFFVHPERGITSMWGVHAEEKTRRAGLSWASVERAA